MLKGSLDKKELYAHPKYVSALVRYITDDFRKSRIADVYKRQCLPMDGPLRNVIVFFFSFPVSSGPETLVFTAFLIGAKHRHVPIAQASNVLE